MGSKSFFRCIVDGPASSGNKSSSLVFYDRNHIDPNSIVPEKWPLAYPKHRISCANTTTRKTNMFKQQLPRDSADPSNDSRLFVGLEGLTRVVIDMNQT